jgi:hypothetical protein
VPSSRKISPGNPNRRRLRGWTIGRLGWGRQTDLLRIFLKLNDLRGRIRPGHHRSMSDMCVVDFSSLLLIPMLERIAQR